MKNDKKGVVNDVIGGYCAYYNSKNFKTFLFKDFDNALSCYNAACGYLNDCKKNGFIAEY